jgi:hypothetical protein
MDALAAALCVGSPTVQAQPAADSAAVRAAVLDYVDGLYEGDTIRFNRSIRRDIHKISFVRDRNGLYRPTQMAWKYFE